MKQIRYIILLSPILFLASCGETVKLQNTTDYAYKYEAAKQFYAQGYYNKASVNLQEVLAMLKGTDKGEESLFLLAMSSFQAHNYDAAASYFKKYAQSYPKGYYAEKANYMAAIALYESIPEVRLDQTATYEAVTQFQNYLELYSNGQYKDRAQKKIFELQDRLVEKEYLSAKLYYDLGSYFGNCTNGGSNYQACIVTAENAIKDYPYTSLREDFAILILRAKFELARQSVEAKKEERYHNAIDEYYGFTNEYPESKYLPEAKKLFDSAKVFQVENGESDNESKTK